MIGKVLSAVYVSSPRQPEPCKDGGEAAPGAPPGEHIRV